ncbi:MAG: hypothetical protein ACRC1H_03445, partial [Caldilineaceae bacterium]
MQEPDHYSLQPVTPPTPRPARSRRLWLVLGGAVFVLLMGGITVAAAGALYNSTSGFARPSLVRN